MICGSGGSKSRLAKAAGAEPAGQMRDEKLHAIVARSTFPSQNVQNTPRSDHFWQLRCWKSARRCGAKYISKSKCTKHTILGPLLEVEIQKKCTPLRREAHFQVKMYKTQHCRTTFGTWDVEKVHAVVAGSTFPSQNVHKTHHVRTTFGSGDVEKVHAVVARSTFRSQNAQNTPCTDHFRRFNVVSRGRRKGLWTLSKVSRTWGFCGIFNYNHHYATTTTTTAPSLHSTTLHSTTLHRTQLHSITLHYITLLHYITRHYITLHYTTRPSTTLHYTPLHLQLHSTTLNYTTLHYTTLHYVPRHSTTLHYITLHYITLNDTAPQIDR